MRVVRRWLGLGGFAGAVVFYCPSLTPSLFPRSWLMQGAVSGLTAAMGYAVAPKRGWKVFPADVAEKKSYLSAKYAPEGLDWGMTSARFCNFATEALRC